jgi:hypothetical protein
VLKLRESAPKLLSSSEALVVLPDGGSIDVTVKARHTDSTGVRERSEDTGWIAWGPERSHWRPRE